MTEKEVDRQLALTVKQARLMSLMSQKEIAEKIGISPKAYWYKERKPGSFSVVEAYRFAKVVGLDINDIIFVPEDTTNAGEWSKRKCEVNEP